MFYLERIISKRVTLLFPSRNIPEKVKIDKKTEQTRKRFAVFSVIMSTFCGIFRLFLLLKTCVVPLYHIGNC